MDSISRQKKYLSENLIVERLRQYETNQEDVHSFSQAKSGNKIAEYLISSAWHDDENNDTKVFLVRDKQTRQIACYYALNCGILYKELNNMQLTNVERACVEKLVAAIRRSKENGLNDIEQDAAYNLLSDAYSAFYEKVDDAERATNLISYAEEQALIKEEKKEAQGEIGDTEFVKNVQETYPAIDIKFLCRNAHYQPGIHLDFKFGVYVFWEIIVPHILEISELVGCKYVYLFAADNTPEKSDTLEMEMPKMYTQDFDPYADDDVPEESTADSEENVKKLVSYYINNFKFHPVSEFMILKPHFERTCYTLIQDVADLAHNRELIWSSHDESEDLESDTE